MTGRDDRHTLLAVLAVVTAAVAGAVAWSWWRESGTPVLREVAVVYRADGEAVASDRARRLPAGARVEAAAVVSFTRRGGPVRRLCALAPVEVGGERVPVDTPAAWPRGYGALRATWFTVEPAVFGALGIAAATADRLRYQEFLAPELGQSLLVRPAFESHNDDFLSAPLAGNTVAAGPLRLKARVGVYRRDTDVLPLQAISSAGAGALVAGGVPTVVAELPEAPGIDPAVAELLRLAAFTFAPGVWPDGGPGWPLPLPPRELVRRRLIATPQAIAAAAACGDPVAAPWGAPATLAVIGGELRHAATGGRVRWEREASAGDAVSLGERWAVLVADDGDGILSPGDRVLFAWAAPARFGPLAEALGGPQAGSSPVLLRRR
jgi:hypothetical protein